MEQPDIHVSEDAKSATIRARLFQLGNSAAGEGTWTSGVYEGTAVDDGDVWKLSGMTLSHTWTASHTAARSDDVRSMISAGKKQRTRADMTMKRFVLVGLLLSVGSA